VHRRTCDERADHRGEQRHDGTHREGSDRQARRRTHGSAHEDRQPHRPVAGVGGQQVGAETLDHEHHRGHQDSGCLQLTQSDHPHEGDHRETAQRDRRRRHGDLGATPETEGRDLTHRRSCQRDETPLVPGREQYRDHGSDELTRGDGHEEGQQRRARPAEQRQYPHRRDQCRGVDENQRPEPHRHHEDTSQQLLDLEEDRGGEERCTGGGVEDS